MIHNELDRSLKEQICQTDRLDYTIINICPSDISDCIMSLQIIHG